MQQEARIYGSQSGQPHPDIKKSPASPTGGGAHRWQMRYDEIKFGKKIGRGAYGEVYEGTYKKGKVAVKVYDFRGGLTVDQQGEIVKEGDLMKGLRSEYLVGFRGICLDQRYCLVMEYCEGGTLRARLNQSERDISLIEQLHWAKQISYGLYQLHSVRIVHRDLKGENILLDKHSDAKVADFGLSIVKTSSAGQSKKSGGTGAAGTLPWMAPELHDDQSNTFATDIYSLGVTLWEIVSRKIPYAGLTVGKMISNTAQGKRDPLPENCPKVFHLMIQACLNLDASQRPTAEAVGDQFEAALKSVEDIPASVGSPPSSKEKEKKAEPTAAAALASMAELARLQPPTTVTPPATQLPPDEALKKLKEMEEKIAKMQLEHEKQLQMQKQAVEEEQRKKQAEIAKLKQQHQAKLERQKKETKLSPPLQISAAPSSTSHSTSSLSPSLSHTLIPPPKAKLNPEQLKLQDALILACEQGDEKEVKNCLSRGAKPDMTNSTGKHPLGAAVWGMCPNVVNALIKQAKGIAPMLWLECEEHNLDCYKEIFIIPEFAPLCLAEWYALAQKINSNLFIRAFHLKKVDEYWHNSDTSSWDNLMSYLHERRYYGNFNDPINNPIRYNRTIPSWTEEGFVSFRTQIQQSIEIASCQRVYPKSHSPLLQDRLVTACKQGDEKAVRALLKQGAKPDIANLEDEQPLIIACKRGNEEIVRALLERGAKPNIASLKGEQPLIIACKQGDEEIVRTLLKWGAKPNIASLKGEQPLGAAVWSMCPGVVNALLEQTDGIASMAWEECEKHNRKHYNEVFIIPKFDPKTPQEWKVLESKLFSNCNQFMQIYFRKKLDEQWQGDDAYSWENMKRWLSGAGLWKCSLEQVRKEAMYSEVTARAIEEEYASYRTQIKQSVETASSSKILSNNSDTTLSHSLRGSLASRSSQILMPASKSLTSTAQLKLQDQLITACKQGDEKAVEALFNQGAKPDMTNARGEQPFGAAVWGMCPEVVNALLKQVGSVAPMTWDECKEHNLKYYKEVFIMSEFDPQTFQDWHSLLLKVDSSPFLQTYQLEKARENWNPSRLSDVSGWETFKSTIWSCRTTKSLDGKIYVSTCANSRAVRETQSGFIALKVEIKRMMLAKPSIGSSYNV